MAASPLCYAAGESDGFPAETEGWRANEAPGNSMRHNRGPSAGPNPWNMTAPDGVIDLPNDILGVILQFGHSCG